MTTLFFTGGGTGGHVFPMIAVADAVHAVRPDVDLVFVGTERGLETKIVPERGYALELLNVAPMRGGGASGAVRGAIRAARAIPAARALLKKHAPRAVFSIGGYAAGPVSVAARSLGVPLALMEPNSAIGFANRLVAPLVQRAYTAFAESEAYFSRNVVLKTGVPIRAGFIPVEYRPSPELRVLVIGGSQGAESLNQAVPRALARAAAKVSVVHQCGNGRDVAVRALYETLGAGSRASVVSFIDDMPRALADADLVIGRAGASAVAEICAVGRPSLLIPYPFAGDHQRFNATSLEASHAAVCILSADATEMRLAAEVDRLAADRPTLKQMAESAQALGRPEAATVIAKDLLSLAGITVGGTSSSTPDGSSAESGESSGTKAAAAKSGSRSGSASSDSDSDNALRSQSASRTARPERLPGLGRPDHDQPRRPHEKNPARPGASCGSGRKGRVALWRSAKEIKKAATTLSLAAASIRLARPSHV